MLYEYYTACRFNVNGCAMTTVTFLLRENTSMDKTKVLVVEDELFVRESCRKRLEMCGYDVDTVDNGDEACRRISQDSYGVVITDLMMPGTLDGMAVLEAVKQKQETARVVMMTGFASGDDAVAALHKGADAFLCKPFEYEELLSILERFKNGDEAANPLETTVRDIEQNIRTVTEAARHVQQKCDRVEKILEISGLDMHTRIEKALEILRS